MMEANSAWISRGLIASQFQVTPAAQKFTFRERGGEMLFNGQVYLVKIIKSGVKRDSKQFFRGAIARLRARESCFDYGSPVAASRSCLGMPSASTLTRRPASAACF